MKAATRDDGTQLPPELDLDLVALARSGPGPYAIQAELPAAWLASVLAHTDAEVTSAGSTSLEVTPLGEGSSYLVRGAVQGGYSVPCARCLAPAAVSAGGEICVHFVRDRVRDAEEDDEDSDSPDERGFSGTRIDLRPLLTEQVLLSYPIRALCAHGEACRGLCMRCGAELNGQPPGPCAACGAADAQVPIASDADLEAAADKPTTSWQAALQQLAGAAGEGAGTGPDNRPLEAAIPADDDVFDPGFERGLGLDPADDADAGKPARPASGKPSGKPASHSPARSGKSSNRKKK